jgi:hypothetical protein
MLHPADGLPLQAGELLQDVRQGLPVDDLDGLQPRRRHIVEGEVPHALEG